jgi:MFS family permease
MSTSRRSAGGLVATASLAPYTLKERPNAMLWILRHTVLRALLVLVGIWAFSFGLTIPFLTLTARDRGVSVDAIGVIAASFLLTQIVFQIPLGALSDRVGRTRPLAAGLALFAVATVGFTQADSAAVFVILRATQGVASALALPAFRALVADVTAPDQRGRAYATLGMAYSGGLLIGPAIGGLLVHAVGRDALFLVTAATEAALAVGVLVGLQGAGRPGQRVVRGERVPLSALLVRPLVAAFILGFAGYFR